VSEDILEYLYQQNKHKPMHASRELIVRIRDEGQPYGTGQAVRFVSDDLDADDPEHVSALVAETAPRC
jgi:hypothetical protein